MGNAYSLATPYAGSASIDIPELADVVHERSLGSGRFMKSIRARHHDGVILAKVTVKPTSKLDLRAIGDLIISEKEKLRQVPNAVAFERCFQSDSNAFLVRQFIHSSLYDRLSTRPFLEDVEKKWLAFQLLCALRDCHAREIYHGDIKTENIMVTSWNWLYLTDFTGSFKPKQLNENNPSAFSYFFDQSGRRTCYVAPERFVPESRLVDDGFGGRLTWSMDIFSAGCVIAEMFLETPIFSLSQLFKYRRRDYDPVISHLSRIPDPALREMLTSMIHYDPEKRYAAEQYLDFYKGRVFPDYFYNFLHQYMELITDPSGGRRPISGPEKNLGEADDRIDRVYYDFDKISYFLGYGEDKDKARQVKNSTIQSSIVPFAPRLGLGLFPLRLNIPNNEHYVSADAHHGTDDGSLIFLTLVASSLRSTARAASKIRACDVLLAFSERLTDEAKLDRVLPYLMALLNDDVDLVAIAALRSVTQLLALVTVITPVNAHVFPEYIMPRMQVFLSGASRQLIMGRERREPSDLVRATYASCLGSLATTASKFLELTAIMRAEGTISSIDPELEAGSDSAAAFDNLFDNAQGELVGLFEVHAKALVEDPDASVRRAFLSSVPELCMFFGSAESNDIILTHLNTYLNDKDWMLKCAFFDTIVGIAPLLGSTSLEEFSLPLMVQAVTDPEEHVVSAALHSLAELAKLGLLSKSKTWELIDVVGRFTMHPNIWIRESAAEYLSSATKLLSLADVRCIVLPLVRPYLIASVIPEFDELALLDALKKPMPRPVFDMALSWAQKTEKGLFWKAVRQQRQSTFTIASTALAIRSSREMQPQTLAKVPRNEEDEQWLTRLRNMGMATEDEFKLLALREFVWRLSQMRNRDASAQEAAATPLNDIIPLRNLDVNLQTIMFDENATIEEPLWSLTQDQDTDRGQYTIADALLDASMTIDEPAARRRRAAINSHRTRLPSRSGAISPRTREDSTHSRAPTQLASPVNGQGASDDSRRTSSATRGPGHDDDASVSDAPYSSRRTVRHQSSALNLMNRKDSGRSIPETGMSGTNAHGKVEGPFSPTPTPKISIPENVPAEGDIAKQGVRLRAAHTYEGNDPSILKMLDNMYIDNYPHDIVEFGPLVTPVSRRRVSKNTAPSGAPPMAGYGDGTRHGSSGGWKPSGRLVATFAEHAGAINRIVPSPDHRFFITGGDDGCVKVWDTSRLERNVTHRARQTHRHAPGARVVALCFIENTHTFVSCATDGRVHIVKVDTAATQSSAASAAAGGAAAAAAAAAAGAGSGGATTTSTKYIRLRLLREYQLPGGEHAVWCEHFRQGHDLASVLVLATSASRVLGIDLRSMTLLWSLENPVHHGPPTCFVLDAGRRSSGGGLRSAGAADTSGTGVGPDGAGAGGVGGNMAGSGGASRNWLLLATAHGVLDLWDLRFGVRLKAWGLPRGGAVSDSVNNPIYRLAIHPTRGRGKWVCVAGGTGLGEVTVWDLEKTACREIYRASSASAPARSGRGGGRGDGASLAPVPPREYKAWDVDEDRPEGMLGRFATSVGETKSGGEGADSSNSGTAAMSMGADNDRGVRAMVVGSGIASSSSGDDGGSGGSSDVRYGYLLTGGADRKLRFWDLHRIENSCVYSGAGAPAPSTTKDVASAATSAQPPPSFAAVSNNQPGLVLNVESLSAPASAAGATTPSRGSRGAAATSRQSSSASPSSPAREKPPRHTVISAEQAALLRSHLDSVNDMAVLEAPYPMTVSVDRSGVIFVFS